ncbi:TonB-dependent receptor [Psychrosphaera sp. B3R10]|uniref:TonB-dependent receptor n=1 Tax=unclassified Psychrosphaera TaxID=2641570 RepID=UPI001C08776B|nr:MULTISPECIES: TonB-dependent receptor [unclassified Psychrosphaera]MBU2883601.1 TonB-dependent receptor [Psychrosphaera sp. I2R16]MBU2989779.1 TonB-dependent receptor [Psychrosphaera sp. B3R10]
MHNFKLNQLTMSLILTGMSFQTISVEVDDKSKISTISQTEVASKVESEVKSDENSDIEVIQVTGSFRRSMVESINIKRFSDTIVDVVTADDLGALPDLSIADALTRLPGVTAVRTGGQSSELNIRGLSGNYVFTTMNGREQVSSDGGRSVEFSQFPSELISSAMVYKSQKASLIEGGVAGTVDLGTSNPLDMEDDSQFHVNAQLTGNSLSGEHPDAASVGHRLSFSYKGKFLDDTLGVAIGGASLFAPSVSNQFLSGAYSYQNVRLDGIPGLTDCLAEGEDIQPSYENVNCISYTDGFELMTRGGEDTRNGIMAAIAWQPTDNFTLKADVFYSKFDSKLWERGIFISGLGSIVSNDINNSVDLIDPVVVGNDTDGYSIIGGEYHSGYYTPFATYEPGTCDQLTAGTVSVPCQNSQRIGGSNPLNIRTSSDNSSRYSDTITVGLNAEWLFDDLTIAIDFSHSKASQDFVDAEMNLMMFDDANAVTPKVDTDLVVNYQTNGLKIPEVSITNEAGQLVDFTDINKMMVVNNAKFPHFEENQADAFKLDLVYELDFSIISTVEAGFRVSNRQHNSLRSMWSYGGPGHYENGVHRNLIHQDVMRAGNYISYQNGQEVARFQPYKLSANEVTAVQLSGEFSTLPAFLAFDPDEISNKWAVDANGNPLSTDGVDVWGVAASWSIGADRFIEEDIQAGYLLANLDTEIVGHALTGNIGLRVIKTTQEATGVVEAPNSQTVAYDDNGDPIRDNNGQTVLEVVGTGDLIVDDVGGESSDYLYRTLEHSYTNILPSINLTFGITDNQYFKFAAAKVMARPQLTEMAVSGGYSYEYDRARDGKNVVNMAMGTNPFIEPFLATQYDFTYEYYFVETDGNAFVALFNKDIESFTETRTLQNYDFAGNGIDVPVYSDIGRAVEPGDMIMTVNNDQGGYIRGVELGYTQVYSMLPGAWSGFGFSGSFSYTESEITRNLDVGTGREDVGVPLEGLSPRVYSATLFYDYEGFDTRISTRYRSEYLGRVSGTSGNIAYVTEETIIDWQASYDITDKFNVLVSVNNLTDEANRSYYGDRSKTGNIQYFGRNYFMGIDYTF